MADIWRLLSPLLIPTQNVVTCAARFVFNSSISIWRCRRTYLLPQMVIVYYFTWYMKVSLFFYRSTLYWTNENCFRCCYFYINFYLCIYIFLLWRSNRSYKFDNLHIICVHMMTIYGNSSPPIIMCVMCEYIKDMKFINWIWEKW